MLKPIWATYGDVENSHQLIHCSDASVKLPDQLAGLTDRPPGDISRDEKWWPSVGCQPLEDWWCLWWSQPSEGSLRAGMVRSEVALWPLQQVDDIQDLTEVLIALSGDDSIALPSKLQQEVITGAALCQKKPAVILCASMTQWPGLLVYLWRLLWPAARKSLALRVALTPPQGGSQIEPLLFAVPAHRSQQWVTSYTLFDLEKTLPLNRAMRYLMNGNVDKTIERLLSLSPEPIVKLAHLERIARAADRWDNFKDKPSFECSVALLRTLNALTSDDKAFMSLKVETTKALSEKLKKASAQQVESIRNISLPEIPEIMSGLRKSLKEWVTQQLCHQSAECGVYLLKGLLPDNGLPWWQSSIRDGLKVSFDNPKACWIRNILIWLSDPELESTLEPLIINLPDRDDACLKVISTLRFCDEQFSQLQKAAIKRGWASLHALCCLETMFPSDAISAQLSYFPDDIHGLRVIVEQLPGQIVVDEALIRDDDLLINLTAIQTAKEPSLLENIDTSSHAGRKLWAEHINQGGVPWFEGLNKAEQCNKLISAAAGGEDCFGLLEKLSNTISDNLVNHPQRKNIWQYLNERERPLLLSTTAKLFLQKINTNQVQHIDYPEEVLIHEILKYIKLFPPTADGVAVLFSWPVALDEDDVLGWVKQFSSVDWCVHGLTIGLTVKQNLWRNIARELNSLQYQIPEAKEAAQACQCLLSWFDVLIEPWLPSSNSYRDQQPPSEKEVLRMVSAIGAELEPESLPAIWERIGGKAGELSQQGTYHDNWQHAVGLAMKGAIDGGVLSIVRELKQRYEHNDKLKAIETILCTYEFSQKN